MYVFLITLSMIWKQELFILNIYFNEKERERGRGREI